ncbi:hypothetical protein NDU88_013334 [Pleurodeles waltl]|uniref:Uncharacterized protein n=1 Tax=Pleurodeles waltl TaxID=8319 RepID=A0AAV7R2V6_PLEWA|nr:hypothetical protein NDU88_013334 [Pleurodeles waltl]
MSALASGERAADHVLAREPTWLQLGPQARARSQTLKPTEAPGPAGAITSQTPDFLPLVDPKQRAHCTLRTPAAAIPLQIKRGCKC